MSLAPPNISIIMSVYNGERYVTTAIESLLTQTYQDFELLIVNDASHDLTPMILGKFSEQDARIQIITNDSNLGLTRSLNNALQKTHGTFIARMDADDVALPQRLEKQVVYLNAHPEVGIVGTAYQFIDNTGSVIGEKFPLTSDHKLRRALIRFNPFLHSSVMMRKVMLDRVHGYDESFRRAQDYDLWMRLSPLTKLANLPDVLMQKRFTTNMISFSHEREQIQSALRVRIQAIKRRQYPFWCLIFLVKPFLATILPSSLVAFMRIHVFKQKMYAHLSVQK